jgi:hypothetical protein
MLTDVIDIYREVIYYSNYWPTLVKEYFTLVVGEVVII